MSSFDPINPVPSAPLAAMVCGPVLWLCAATCAAQEAPRDDLPMASPAPALLAASPGAAAHTARYWQRAMLWQRRDRVDLGFGLAVLRDTQSQGPLAAQRGADTSSLGGRPGTAAAPGAPAMALLAVGRSVTPAIAWDVGMDLPLNRGLSDVARGQASVAGLLDGRGGEGAAAAALQHGELRMGLSFRSQGAYADLRRGLDLRMELSGATALTVRPRGGRVTLQLSSRW